MANKAGNVLAIAAEAKDPALLGEQRLEVGLTAVFTQPGWDGEIHASRISENTLTITTSNPVPTREDCFKAFDFKELLNGQRMDKADFTFTGDRGRTDKEIVDSFKTWTDAAMERGYEPVVDQKFQQRLEEAVIKDPSLAEPAEKILKNCTLSWPANENDVAGFLQGKSDTELSHYLASAIGENERSIAGIDIKGAEMFPEKKQEAMDQAQTCLSSIQKEIGNRIAEDKNAPGEKDPDREQKLQNMSEKAETNLASNIEVQQKMTQRKPVGPS
ncbi:MAG: hypothetical protein SFW66_03835 [Gammaproteobacteria bacterium]|nr:hypothetical protein [Gammaproteobacteria bacterium]